MEKDKEPNEENRNFSEQDDVLNIKNITTENLKVEIQRKRQELEEKSEDFYAYFEVFKDWLFSKRKELGLSTYDDYEGLIKYNERFRLIEEQVEMLRIQKEHSLWKEGEIDTEIFKHRLNATTFNMEDRQILSDESRSELDRMKEESENKEIIKITIKQQAINLKKHFDNDPKLSVEKVIEGMTALKEKAKEHEDILEIIDKNIEEIGLKERQAIKNANELIAEAQKKYIGGKDVKAAYNFYNNTIKEAERLFWYIDNSERIYYIKYFSAWKVIKAGAIKFLQEAISSKLDMAQGQARQNKNADFDLREITGFMSWDEFKKERERYEGIKKEVEINKEKEVNPESKIGEQEKIERETNNQTEDITEEIFPELRNLSAEETKEAVKKFDNMLWEAGEEKPKEILEKEKKGEGKEAEISSVEEARQRIEFSAARAYVEIVLNKKKELLDAAVEFRILFNDVYFLAQEAKKLRSKPDENGISYKLLNNAAEELQEEYNYEKENDSSFSFLVPSFAEKIIKKEERIHIKEDVLNYFAEEYIQNPDKIKGIFSEEKINEVKINLNNKVDSVAFSNLGFFLVWMTEIKRDLGELDMNLRNFKKSILEFFRCNLNLEPLNIVLGETLYDNSKHDLLGIQYDSDFPPQTVVSLDKYTRGFVSAETGEVVKKAGVYIQGKKK